MEYFKELSSNISDFVRKMSPSQAIMLIGVTLSIIVGLVVTASWIGGEINYSVLYSQLDPSEAAEVVAYLGENNKPHKLSDGGRTIMVPSDDVYSLRISLASEGLPQSGNIGYSIFDQSNLGMTEFLQNLNFRRALEGELMKTIMQLNNVQAARVHIVMPKPRLFKKDKLEATASIVLKLKKMGGLDKSQLSGITHLVASSVEGLKPENISIVDYHGNLLSSEIESDVLAGLSSSQLEVRKNAENYLEDKAQSMLDGVIGPGKSIIRVSVDMNFKQVEKTSESYDPNTPVIRSEEKTEESAVASDKQDEFAESKDDKKIETSIANYEISKTVEHIVNSVGNIDRLSVAVMIDGVYRDVENAEGVLENVYEPRPQEEIDRITAIVKSAVGFDQQRSDQIEVVNISFDNQSMEHDQQKLDQMVELDFYYDIATKIGWGLLAILVLLYARSKAKRLFRALGRLLPGARIAPPPVVEEEEEEEDEMGIVDEEPPPVVIKKKRKATVVDAMQKVANDKPEEVARAIKTMMLIGAEDE
ncbi:MAG: flagellar M-ring protein FliF [candidate division Zixibacteria bacterium]|nr:flagellar M-ring protein FliF [candidate division Zixibacteria bacterium]